MERNIVIAIICLSAVLQAKAFNTRLVHVTDSAYGATSVNTAIFRAAPLATSDSVQYISYYDHLGRVVVGKRNPGSDRWQLSTSRYSGRVADAHNVISIGVDGNGCLHLSFDQHDSPLQYCRAVAPGSIELGELQPMTGTGEEKVTYPEFHPLPGGDILFAYRDGSAGNGNLAINRYDCSSGLWKRVSNRIIDGEGKRSPYWQIHIDPHGTVHLSWTWREDSGVETNHDICYARSFDGGVTWYRADGTPQPLPITERNAGYALKIPQGSDLINQTSIAADSKGNPYIATYWRDQDSYVPQYRVLWHDGNAWDWRQLGDRIDGFSLSGGGTKMIPYARPWIAIQGDTILFLERIIEEGGHVMLGRATLDPFSEWTYDRLTPFTVNAWEPSVDRSLWNMSGRLDVYVQPSFQGDGETVTDAGPQPAYVLEIEP